MKPKQRKYTRLLEPREISWTVRDANALHAFMQSPAGENLQATIDDCVMHLAYTPGSSEDLRRGVLMIREMILERCVEKESESAKDVLEENIGVNHFEESLVPV